MDFHKQKISIIITSFTISLVDTIPLIVDQRLHSVWELPAKAVNIMVLLSGRKISESPGGSLTRIVYQLGHYSTRSTRINSDFGIVSDDLDGTNRGLSDHLGKQNGTRTPFNKSSLSQRLQRICLVPQNDQHQLRLGIPLASQFPN